MEQTSEEGQGQTEGATFFDVAPSLWLANLSFLACIV